MDNDLDTSSAMALIFDAVRRANIAAENGDSATTAALASAVAIFSSDVRTSYSIKNQCHG
ncbi:MAG: DALR domain-containing protein [Actinomycetes bacterium]